MGFVLNSVNMTVSLTPEKMNRINDKCFELLSEVNMTIHDLAEVIGLLVSIFPGVLYGPLFYRHLENDKTTVLRESKGNYSAYMTLFEESLQELQWWCDNIENVDYKICIPNSKINITLYTDASNDGWGAVMGTSKTGGRWNEAEASHHINYLELMAIFFGLKAFCMKEYSVHIQVYSDNTTAVTYINSMGGTHSMECHSVAKTIWFFCMGRKIWLSAVHIPGKGNITADRESRIFSDNKEWMLSPHLFQ